MKRLLTVIIFIVGKVLCTNNNNLKCGGVFNEKQYVIESPNYPANYPDNLDCTYYLNGQNCPVQYQMQFLDFSLEPSLGCSGDRLEISNKDALCGNVIGTKNYLAEKGVLPLRFVTNTKNSARGFRILITRSSCINETSTNNDLQHCCGTSYKSKRFVLASPNFPYSNQKATNCYYQVQRANQKVCRLRMHFYYFWSGNGRNCNVGYLEIDGKRICGCRNGLKLIAPFGVLENFKNIKFTNRGFERGALSGFVVEVIQDECPKRLNNTEEISSNFTKNTTVDVVKEQTEKYILPPPWYLDLDTNYVRRFNPEEVYAKRRDVEETNYYDTSAMKDFLPETDDAQCRNWWYFQWMTLLNKATLGEIPKCEINNQNEVSKRCQLVQLPYIRGYFASPGYPYYYPANINNCYRFFFGGGELSICLINIFFRIMRQDGYCQLRLLMLDFNLENSRDCFKDYLLSESGRRYCGSSLMNVQGK